MLTCHSTGTLISLLFIFFTLQFPKGGSIQVNWWGNNVWKNSTSDFFSLWAISEAIPPAADARNPPLKATGPEGF